MGWGAALLAALKALPELAKVGNKVLDKLDGIQDSITSYQTEKFKQELAKEITRLNKRPSREEILDIVRNINRL